MSHAPQPPRPKQMQCSARMVSPPYGKAVGERCEEPSIHCDPDGHPLCWVHAHARYNEKRSVPLEMVPL